MGALLVVTDSHSSLCASLCVVQVMQRANDLVMAVRVEGTFTEVKTREDARLSSPAVQSWSRHPTKNPPTMG